MDNNINENTPDIGELIGKLTSDPNMMQQISKIAESLKGTSTSSDVHDSDDGEAIAASAMHAPKHNQHSHRNFSIDNHTHLFNALKPYLNDERKSTLEYIMQLFSVIKLLEMSGLNLNSLIPTNLKSNPNDISEE